MTLHVDALPDWVARVSVQVRAKQTTKSYDMGADRCFFEEALGGDGTMGDWWCDACTQATVRSTSERSSTFPTPNAVVCG